MQFGANSLIPIINHSPVIVKWVPDPKNELGHIYIGTNTGDILGMHVSAEIRQSHTISSHCIAVTSLSYIPNLNQLVSTSIDGSVVLTDLNTFSEFAQIDCSDLLSPKATVDETGSLIAIVGDGANVFLYNDGQLQGPFKLSCDEFLIGAGFSESQLVTISRHFITQFDPKTQTETTKIGGHQLRHPLYSIATSPLSPLTAVGSYSDNACLDFYDFREESTKPTHTVLVRGNLVESIEYSHSGEQLVVGCSNKRIHLIDLRNLDSDHPIYDTTDKHKSRVLSVSFSPDDRSVVSVGEDGRIIVFKDKVLEPTPDE